MTIDRAIDLAGNGCFLDVKDYELPMECPDCHRIWKVPPRSLAELARIRGNRVLYVLVQEIPGVSLKA